MLFKHVFAFYTELSCICIWNRYRTIMWFEKNSPQAVHKELYSKCRAAAARTRCPGHLRVEACLPGSRGDTEICVRIDGRSLSSDEADRLKESCQYLEKSQYKKSPFYSISHICSLLCVNVIDLSQIPLPHTAAVTPGAGQGSVWVWAPRKETDGW